MLFSFDSNSILILKTLLKTLMTFSLLMTACSPNDRAATIAQTPGEIEEGEELFSINCASCHGAKALGGVGPNLVTFSAQNPVTTVANVILNGQGSMPNFSSLDDQEIADLIAYLKSL